MDSRQKARTAIQGFYPLVETASNPAYPPYRMAEDLLSCGPGILQLRQKGIDPREFMGLAMEIAYLKIHNSFQFIVNHFVGVAREVGADGVHLGSQSTSIAQARALLGPDKIIGVSVHSVEEGLQKEREGADYLTFGAIYPSPSKKTDHPVQGVEKLRELARQAAIPVVAIGGITLSRIGEMKEAGAAGFSAVSEILNASDTGETARMLKRSWEKD